MTIISIEDDVGVRCIDLFARADGTVSFIEFRRDPEGEGRWTLVEGYSSAVHENIKEAIDAACHVTPWMADRRSPQVVGDRDPQPFAHRAFLSPDEHKDHRAAIRLSASGLTLH